MSLKLYVDRLSQPSRALLIFCKLNGIEFEEVPIELSKGQHRSPEFAEINPMKQVPAIVHGSFTLFESHAILRYLASAFPEVADHWYPSDLQKRAKIESVLDWHHSNLRRGSVGYVLNSTLAPALGLPLNPQAAAEGEKILSASLAKIDTYWLQKDGSFLLGNSQPSIADLNLVCEIMQLEFVDEKDRDRILSPHKNVLKWIDDVKSATAPHFDEIHATLFKVKEIFQKQPSAGAST
ncbi:glutathione S-transferase T1-like [Nicotiana sylvestris]|uniref:glutathione transferase n=1 Tax=Nicotiana sylvestris TaxID=4096 RepID=A0A1U7YBI6_NICSY|nr:PREDICTED: glutathione S-transferase T1-like [Nicotiana sylvestris]